MEASGFRRRFGHLTRFVREFPALLLRDPVLRSSAQAGRVEVDLRHDDDDFRLRVRDDGQGIDAAVLANQGLCDGGR
jgi:signal transduction histidine kinase